MIHIGKVVCAIIEEGDNFLIAQRSELGSFSGRWEFPGGKVYQGENPTNAIKREIYEETKTSVVVALKLPEVDYSYSNHSLTLVPFLCHILQGIPQPIVHKRIQWVNAKTVWNYDILEADRLVLQEYLVKCNYRNSEIDF